MESTPEIGANTGAHDRKVQNVRDELDPAASSPHSEEKKTAKSELMKEVTPRCLSDMVDFRMFRGEA